MSAALRNLSDLQAEMMQSLLGVEPAPALLESIRAAANAPAADAISIYRRSMHSTLLNTLRLIYPTVGMLVGRDFFTAAASAFARATPSRHGDLDRYGAGFDQHLNGLPPASGLPWLADLARFEWQLHELHLHAPEPALTRMELAGMDAAAIADSCFGLVRRAVLFESPWPVARIWLAHRDNADDPDFDGVEAGPDRVLLRAAEPATVIPLHDASWIFFKALARGNTLLSAVEQARSADVDFDLQSVLGTALDSEVLVALRA